MKYVFYIWVLCLLLISLDESKGQRMEQSICKQQTSVITDSGSTQSLLGLLVATHATMDVATFSEINNRLNRFYLHLKQAKPEYSSDKRYIKWVYEQVRKEFLQQYSTYPSFHQLFSQGIYNCLSGTALYALILQELNYTVEIHETAFHAYLLVKLPKRDILIDGTDPLNGFRADQYSIKQRELLYKQTELAKHQPYFNRIINSVELAGLLYYNEATLVFNRQHYKESRELLEKALKLYPRSERIASLLQSASLYHQQSSTLAEKTAQKNNIRTTASTGLSNK